MTDSLYTPEELSPELVTNRPGVCIRGGRGKEGLTQKQLADQIGIAQHHISEMEKRASGCENSGGFRSDRERQQGSYYRTSRKADY